MPEYNTTDLYIAAVLMTLGHELLGVRIDPTTPTRKIFTFNDADGRVHDDVDAFWSDMPINILSYVQNFQALKRRLYSKD